jgi:hypothetical protein
MIRYPNDMATDPPARSRRLARAFAVAIAVATAIGSGYFAVTSAIDPGALVPGGDAHAARVYAGYVSARGIVLLGALLWCAAARAWRALSLVLVLNGFVQLLDTVLGALQHEVASTVGPACFAAALLGIGWWLSRREVPVHNGGAPTSAAVG